jgi:hypothetical protein
MRKPFEPWWSVIELPSLFLRFTSVSNSQHNKTWKTVKTTRLPACLRHYYVLSIGMEAHYSLTSTSLVTALLSDSENLVNLSVFDPTRCREFIRSLVLLLLRLTTQTLSYKTVPNLVPRDSHMPCNLSGSFDDARAEQRSSKTERLYTCRSRSGFTTRLRSLSNW